MHVIHGPHDKIFKRVMADRENAIISASVYLANQIYMDELLKNIVVKELCGVCRLICIQNTLKNRS
ncbi:hypothetical protein Dthio_PD0460 [Desulfonatronospira thiodismutans ASO3-1]|uniref:Uncharacterized protein n=1 Tax=Desulfonatronospira thiodismutans ASO3-1 TaxID=555779 RepID=D6SR24_9BACT|nr:hypothetical protein Dthio_PD0460 [Desulfonatronospira thiodismutans ASO3-1]